jgi:anti-sigma factor RsiW
MNATKQEAPGRQDIEELLPWHAAGTLSRRDARRVEEALARDPELARRYEMVRDELGETIHLNETLGAPSARAMEKLFAKIDAEPARRQGSLNASLNLGSRISEFFASLTPRTLALASGAAVLAILVQAGFIAGVMLNETTTGGYQTASAPATAPDAGAFAIIRFAPQASSEDITRFLEANKLSIASGPMAGGLYKVRVAVTVIPKAELARIVKKLQEDKAVGFIATTE